MYICTWKKVLKKEWFYGIYLKIKQLKVGHNVITIDEAWMSYKLVQHNIDYRRPQWGRYVELNNTHTLCTFSTLWDSSQPEKTAMENAINVSLLSIFLQKLKSSFSWRPSWYAQWEVRGVKLERHLKFILYRKCEQSYVQRIIIDGVVLHMMIKPTKDTLISHSHFSCSFSFLLLTVTTAMHSQG